MNWYERIKTMSFEDMTEELSNIIDAIWLMDDETFLNIIVQNDGTEGYVKNLLSKESSEDEFMMSL